MDVKVSEQNKIKKVWNGITKVYTFVLICFGQNVEISKKKGENEDKINRMDKNDE